jgi:hypothetical protein
MMLNPISLSRTDSCRGCFGKATIVATTQVQARWNLLQEKKSIQENKSFTQSERQTNNKKHQTIESINAFTLPLM